MIQDWGFNNIYLQQKEAITRIHVKDHSYHDLAKIHVKDFDLATTKGKSTIPSWANVHTQLWMCGALVCGRL